MQVFRVSLEGYNALTDTDPNHFSLYADQDNVLIKEKVRGSQSVGAWGTVNIAHGLAYIPFALVFVEVSTGVFRKCYGPAIDGSGYYYQVTATNIVLRNNTGASKTFKYYIFYDEMD